MDNTTATADAATAADAAGSDAPGGGAAGDGAGDIAAATTSGAPGGDPNPFDVTYIPFDNNIFQLGARLARYVPRVPSSTRPVMQHIWYTVC